MKRSNVLFEKFGAPLDPIYGTKIGDVEGITDVGAVGVRNIGMDEDIVVCPVCGEMPIDGSCGCANSEVCPMCGHMPPKVDAACSCGLTEAVGSCAQCGMSEAMCQCGAGGMYEDDVNEKQYYPNLSKSDAKERLSSIKKKHGSEWDDMKKAFGWAEDPDAALKALELKAGVK